MTVTATQVEHPIGTDGLFLLRMRGGAARLRGVDGETVRVRTDADLEGSFRVERGEGSLSIQAAQTFDLRVGRRAAHAPEFDVDLPHRATVVVEVASADLTADSLRGDQRYRTVSGDLSLRSVAGSVEIDAVSGDVRLSAAGELALRARTVSGDLEVRAGRIANLGVTTTSGDVRFAGELATGTTHRIETVSGDMTLALAGGVRLVASSLAGDVRLVASSLAGDVRSDVPHRSEGGRGHRTLIVGDARSTLETSSMSGSVRLVQARDIDSIGQGPVEAPVAPEPPPPALPAPPAVPEPPAAPSLAEPIATARDDEERLAVLRALERGEIDVAAAGRQLARLDAGEAGEADR